MNTITKITCKIPELGEYQLKSLVLKESLGDVLPTGKLEFLQDLEEEDLSIEYLSLNLIIDDEYQLSMKAFVETVTNFKGSNIWLLTFVPKEFYQKPNINEFNNIKDLINNLCPYDLLSPIESDSKLDNVKLYQNNISDYLCLINYLRAMQKDYIYGFRFDGLYFADLKGKPSSEINISSVHRFIPLQVNRSKFKSLEASEYELSSNELVNVHYNNSTIGVTSKFSKAYMNYLENSQAYKYLEDKIEYEFPDYMNLRIGDLIKLVGTEFENNNYIVTDNTLVITKGEVKNTLKFAAI